MGPLSAANRDPRGAGLGCIWTLGFGLRGSRWSAPLQSKPRAASGCCACAFCAAGGGGAGL